MNSPEHNNINTPKPDENAGTNPKKPDITPTWIEKLAQQSTGLHKPEPLQNEKTTAADAAESRRLWRLAGLGIQFAATVTVFYFIGDALDAYFGSRPIATMTAVILAVIGNLYLLIKEALKANR